MIENIKLVLISKLKSLNWMDGSTKANAIDKAKEIGILVGYPEWLKNSSYLESYYNTVSIIFNFVRYDNNIFFLA